MKTPMQKKIQEVGVLLARSMLAEDIKEAIISSSAFLSEETIDQLLDVLKKEQKYMDRFEGTLKKFQTSADTQWKKVAVAQERAAKEWVATTAKKLASA